MDGSNHTVLINGSNLGWPNGLAIDFDMDFVYWADARTDTIERMTMDGLDRRIILSGVQHPFGLALNNERIFYSDWQEKCIFSISRKNISEKLILRRALVGLMEVQIYDPALQTGIVTLPTYENYGIHEVISVESVLIFFMHIALKT